MPGVLTYSNPCVLRQRQADICEFCESTYWDLGQPGLLYETMCLSQGFYCCEETP